MGELLTRGEEITQVPDVVLSQRAFESAQEAGITGIVANRDTMLAIGQITQTGTKYVPDLTVMRKFSWNSAEWEKELTEAAAATRYFPPSELTVVERDKQFVTAGSLRSYQQAGGKTILNLAVKDWDQLGDALAETIEQAEKFGQPRSFGGFLRHAVDAVGGISEMVTRKPGVSPMGMHRCQAAGLQPYHLTRRSAESK